MDIIDNDDDNDVESTMIWKKIYNDDITETKTMMIYDKDHNVNKILGLRWRRRKEIVAVSF